MKRLSFIFVVLAVFFFIAQVSFAKDIPEVPVIKPYPGSVLAKNMSNYEKYGEEEFSLINKATKKMEKKKVRGKHWKLLWEVRTSKGARVQDISNIEFVENFKNAALQVNGEILFESSGLLNFRIPKDDGGYIWCRVSTVANLGQVYMYVIDEKGFKQSIVFGADEMKKALDESGKVLLYGILFDLDKADLKQESEKQLSNIVTLMLRNPGLKVEIQGHTDNQGKPDYNMKLSQARAETVKTYLKLFGIKEDRLKAKGFGESKPVASNQTEGGRAKNRRVELVKF